ncbi:hypothetical protein DL96DRAFT_1708122 [Flagelloscypha sp. PMI_526]|nr:hypothetical protein DL96DRAFT_1708122 [Flagelloscypha sp. PMI_526]
MGAFDTTIGMSCAAWLLSQRSIYLSGVVSYQYMTYKNMDSNDPIWLRNLVALLFVIDTSVTIAEFYAVWYYAVENYANPSVFGEAIWTTSFTCVMTAISSLIVQAFWINQLHRLTGQRWLCIILIVASTVSSLCGVINGIMIGVLVDVGKVAGLIPLSTIWGATEAGVNIIITFALSRALWRNKTRSPRTNALINRLIWASIQSGLFSSIFALAALMTFIFSPKTLLCTIFAWPWAKTYSNSLLYTLVSRQKLAEIAYGTVDMGPISFPMSTHASSIHIKRKTATDAKVAGRDLNTSLDQHIAFSRSPSTT